MAGRALKAAVTALLLGGVQSQDWRAIREDIREVLERPSHDDGSLAPIVLRLAWHSSGHYDPNNSPTGGASGATMRFTPESEYDENNGLELARDAMEAVKLKHPDVSYSDLWVLGSYVAIEVMDGPVIAFTPGRIDAPRGGNLCPPEERLTFFDETAASLRQKMNRMGLNDRDIVALMGAHSVGRTHDENSGFPFASWDNTPVRFDRNYYNFLIEQPWLYDEANGMPYYRNRSWIMLLSDFLMKEDPEFLQYVLMYSDSQDAWFTDFSSAFKRLTELGLNDTSYDKEYAAIETAGHVHTRAELSSGGGCPFSKK